MYKNLFLISIFLLTFTSFSQDNKVNKLKQSLTNYYKNKGVFVNQKDTIYINVLKELSAAYLLKNNDSSDYFIEEAIHITKVLNLKRKEVNLHKSFGVSLLKRGEYSKAILFFDNGLAALKRLKKSNETSMLYYLKAQCYLMIDKLPQSFLFSNKALLDCQKNNDVYGIADAYNILAVIYSKQGKDDLVLDCYTKGLSVLKEKSTIEAKRAREFLEFNLGVYYLEQKKHNKALKIFLKFYDNPFKESNLQKGKTAKVIGETYYKLSKYEKAEMFYNIAINIHLEANKKSELADAYIGLGEAIFPLKKHKEAIYFTEKGLQISIQIGELSSVKLAYKNLAHFYATQKKYKEAYLNYHSFKTISDSIFNREINNEITDIQHQYDLKKQEENFRVKQVHKDEISAKDNKNKSLLLLALLFFCLLLSTIVFGVYKSLKESKKQQLINEQSIQIKDVLIRETHHRVKNNLQIIIGLFGIQSQQLQDENTLKIINDGQRRVEAMSLIHEGLYHAEDISRIEIKKYLNDLVNHLSQIFIGDSNNIIVHLEVDQIYFDIDTTVPLGLMINELLSNSFKYGFKKQQKGNIYIKIEKINDINYSLEVSNDGDPLYKNFDIHKTESFGLKLVHLLSRQLRGAFSNQSNSQKTIFNVQFKDLRAFNNLLKK